MDAPSLGTYDEPRHTLQRRFARVRADLGIAALSGDAFDGTEATASFGARIGKSHIRLNARRASRTYADNNALVDWLYGIGSDVPLGDRASVTIDATLGIGHKNTFLPRSELGVIGDIALWPMGSMPVEVFGGLRHRSYVDAKIPTVLAGVVFPSGGSIRATVRGDVSLINGVLATGTGIVSADPFEWLSAGLGATAGKTAESVGRNDRFVEMFAQLRFAVHPRLSLGVDAARYQGKTRSEVRAGATAACFL